MDVTRAEATERLITVSTRLSALHQALPALLEAKADTYADAYFDRLSDGYSATASRELATIAANAHTATYERTRGEVSALAEEASLLMFLIEQDLLPDTA